MEFRLFSSPMGPLCFLVLNVALTALIASPAIAAEYTCAVERKVDSERIYSKDDMSRGQFSVLVEEGTDGAFQSRCSFSMSTQKITCDRYKADQVVVDPNVKIKKFYVFNSQFDVQVFSNLHFIENNGRGTVAYGKCSLTSP